MKILHIFGGNIVGGAARGAYWLHLALKNNGISSKILVAFNSSKEEDIVPLIKGRKERYVYKLTNLIEKLLLRIYPNRKTGMFSLAFSGHDITEIKEYKEADVIHMHWVNDGMININLFSKIKKPIVWTFRDMWPFTGGCHYSLNCDRYQIGCGKCPLLKSNYEYDLSKYLIKRKKKYYKNNIFAVAVSNWLKECAEKSYIFSNYHIKVICNGVNIETFRPIDKKIAKKDLGLPVDKKIILAGVMSANDIYKGYEKLYNALGHLCKEKYMLLLFGNIQEKEIDNIKMECKVLGFIKDDNILIKAYSSADVYVLSSIQEAFGKTIIESMACNTPVVCFDNSGPRDIITHKEDGYKASPFDSKDLANGIEWITNNENYEYICRNAREKVLREYNINEIAKKYISFYQEIINETNNSRLRLG